MSVLIKDFYNGVCKWKQLTFSHLTQGTSPVRSIINGNEETTKSRILPMSPSK